MSIWTEEEIEILKNNHQNKPRKDLCIILPDRTHQAISKKCMKLKLYYQGICPEKRFWKHVDKKLDHECWNWIGYHNHNGYGSIKVNKKLIRVHRFSWVLHNGKIPNETPCVLHYCDNPKCVNPGHLFLGTQYDNVHDMISKNRANNLKGENHGSHKLTLDQVKYIRAAKGKISQTELGKMFNVVRETISAIHRNITWKS